MSKHIVVTQGVCQRQMAVPTCSPLCMTSYAPWHVEAGHTVRTARPLQATHRAA